jgi:LysM repeat protein
LVLHVVAVSGIIAFNAIKTRQSSPSLPINGAAHENTSTSSLTKPENATPHTVMSLKENTRHEETKASRSPGKQTAKEDKKSEHGKPTPGSAADASKVYVVAKGDNPVTIAKKLKVSYDELLALNHIDDPKKLQIGQKLLIPKTKIKKTDE